MKRRFLVLLGCCLMLSGCVQKEYSSTENDGTEAASAAETSAEQEDVPSEKNDEKTFLQAYFDGNIFPADEEIMEVNIQAEAGNYRVTVCEVLLDKLSCYFLVKLETIDGSILPSGNLSMAPETHSVLLTDIYWNYTVYIWNEDRSYSQCSTLYCDRIDNNEEAGVGYFILGGDNYIDDYGALAAAPDTIEMVIDNIALYAPYYEAAEKEEPLVNETLSFEIPVTRYTAGKTKTVPDGNEGYLTPNGFCINTDLDPKEYPSVVWTITFDDDTVLSSKELDKATGGWTLREGGLLCLSWFGKYIDVDKVSVITINGEDYEWKQGISEE